jgi:hypothetical protein
MIKHYLHPTKGKKLWGAYVDIEYGRTVPEKKYKGYRTFLVDVTCATKIEGNTRNGFDLYFEDQSRYTWFMLKWL